jgi:hypothetical protein
MFFNTPVRLIRNISEINGKTDLADRATNHPRIGIALYSIVRLTLTRKVRVSDGKRKIIPFLYSFIYQYKKLSAILSENIVGLKADHRKGNPVIKVSKRSRQPKVGRKQLKSELAGTWNVPRCSRTASAKFLILCRSAG